MSAVSGENRWGALSVVWTACTASHAPRSASLAKPVPLVYSAEVKFFRGALRNFSLGLLTRRALRALDRVESRLTEQNTYLKRLADHFAPVYDSDGEVPERSVDFLNGTEAGLVLDYVEKTQREMGRPPTDEEILRYLADEATIDLTERMEGR